MVWRFDPPQPTLRVLKVMVTASSLIVVWIVAVMLFHDDLYAETFNAEPTLLAVAIVPMYVAIGWFAFPRARVAKVSYWLTVLPVAVFFMSVLLEWSGAAGHPPLWGIVFFLACMIAIPCGLIAVALNLVAVWYSERTDFVVAHCALAMALLLFGTAPVRNVWPLS
jgi:hypothetical protein